MKWKNAHLRLRYICAHGCMNLGLHPRTSHWWKYGALDRCARTSWRMASNRTAVCTRHPWHSRESGVRPQLSCSHVQIIGVFIHLGYDWGPRPRSHDPRISGTSRAVDLTEIQPSPVVVYIIQMIIIQKTWLHNEQYWDSDTATSKLPLWTLYYKQKAPPRKQPRKQLLSQRKSGIPMKAGGISWMEGKRWQQSYSSSKNDHNLERIIDAAHKKMGEFREGRSFGVSRRVPDSGVQSP